MPKRWESRGAGQQERVEMAAPFPFSRGSEGHERSREPGAPLPALPTGLAQGQPARRTRRLRYVSSWVPKCTSWSRKC